MRVEGVLTGEEVMERVCRRWLGVEGVQGVHEASLSYQRHSRLLCPNGNYTAHNWHSLFGSQQQGGKKKEKSKKLDGGMRRRDIKEK